MYLSFAYHFRFNDLIDLVDVKSNEKVFPIARETSEPAIGGCL